MVRHASRRSDDNVRPGCQLQRLCAHVNAADEDADLEVLRGSESRELFSDLQGELTIQVDWRKSVCLACWFRGDLGMGSSPCGRQDDGKDAEGIAGPLLQDGCSKSDGFTGTGAGAANAVLSCAASVLRRRAERW